MHDILCWHYILGVCRLQKVRNEIIRNILEQEETVIDKIQKRRLRLYGSVTWKGWKIIDSYTRHSTATSKAWGTEEDKGKRGLTTWKKIWRRKMQTLKQQWNWYETGRSEGISCSLDVGSADRWEQRRRGKRRRKYYVDLYNFLGGETTYKNLRHNLRGVRGLDWGVQYPHFSGRKGEEFAVTCFSRSDLRRLNHNKTAPDLAHNALPDPKSRVGRG